MTDILIVEDTSAMLMIYEGLLTRDGFETCVAETAQDAVRVFAREEPKVILLDLMLPDRDGLDLMQDFLSLQPSLKIVVITANGSMNKAVEAMRLGAFDFLVKPVGDERLLKTLSLALERAGDPAAVAVTQNPDSEAEASVDLAVQRLVGIPFDEVERALIEATIERCNGSLPKAAEVLKVAPSTLYRKREAWLK